MTDDHLLVVMNALTGELLQLFESELSALKRKADRNQQLYDK